MDQTTKVPTAALKSAYEGQHGALEDTPLAPVVIGPGGMLDANSLMTPGARNLTPLDLTRGMSLVSATLPSPADFFSRTRHTLSPEELQAAFARREAALSAAKAQASHDWTPEYVPPSIIPQRFKKGTLLKKAARVSAAMILKDVSMARKTKIVCTLGPACWSEQGLSDLIDAGMNVARFNFSHGEHAGHKEVLDRLRKVAAGKGSFISYALDTKGPEIRTAMIKGGGTIDLKAGQEVIVVAVGPEQYTQWEGYVEEDTGRAVIGLSYDKLCQYVKPGNTILLSDGTITIEVKEILDDKRLLGRVENSHALGQRKNCNLPGVHTDLPVLGPKDVDDVKNFAAKYDMDYIFASFVQHSDDVRFIREVLYDAGAAHIKIICKIESQAGLTNFDDILTEADGIMVARGDLAMEIPPEKVALAQKMMINKCQAYGKLVICATQMMESMIENPMPSRAEETDVANAVFDGTGAVMLSGETANGKHPSLVVTTMGAIVATAELAVDYQEQFHAIRSNNAAMDPVSSAESLFEGVCQQALGFCADKDGDGIIDLGEGCLIVVLSSDGTAAQMISKYRPPCPIVVVSDSERVLRSLSGYYGIFPCKVPQLSKDTTAEAVDAGVKAGLAMNILRDGMKVLEVTGPEGSADVNPIVTTENLGLRANSFIQKREAPKYVSPFDGNTTFIRSTVQLSKDIWTKSANSQVRFAKIVATLGPSTWTPEGMSRLLASDIDVVRFNVKHQTPQENQMLLEMWRAVAQTSWENTQQKLGIRGMVRHDASPVGIMVSIRGHEVRSARLANNQPVPVAVGETIEFEAVGEDYIRWAGGRQAEGVVKIGLSLNSLAHCKLDDVVQVDDGNLKVEVTELVRATCVRGKALNSHTVKEMALVHVKGTFKHGQEQLSSRDKSDIEFAAQNQVTYLTVPFVCTAADVLEIRRLLDAAGGPAVKIVAQIDTGAAVRNYDEILRVADAIMVSRTNLGMVIKPEKVPLAQKWLIQKARLASRPVMVAGQLMEGMALSPRPSRPEITDVVNAVYDGADAVVLMQETSCGQFAEACVSTVAKIIADAEALIDAGGNYSFIRNFTPKPLPTIEAAASSAVETLIDCQGSLLLVFSNSSAPVRLAAKYRPGVPILVLTKAPRVASVCSMLHGAVAALLDSDTAHSKADLILLAVELSRKLSTALGLPIFQAGDGRSDQVVLLCGPADEPILDVHNFNSAEVACLTFGDESALINEPVGYRGEHTLSMRSTKVSLDLITAPVHSARKTKIVCTLGPSCWSDQILSDLIDAGMNVARFNFSHGEHAGHKEVLDRLRKVKTEKHAHHVATMLDTKGPEIRTAMIKGGGTIDLKAGQEVIVVAVGPEQYTQWEGYVEEDTGRAVIGLSYDKLCRDVKPGGRILLADGSVTIKVKEIIDDTHLLGTCLNPKALGQRKNCNLPGVLVDLPVLGPKDVEDVQKFAAAFGMDFVAASFVQHADDVRFIRKTLDEAGGQNIKIISKIESWHGVTNFDDILALTDGIMVARGDLAMEVPSEKVALAQKMMTTKANIAGKFVITATQMLESMTSNPLPTRAEMTDVANAVFDGTDAVMLSGETANGSWPTLAVSTMANIVTNAEVGVNSYQNFQYIREFTDRPMDSRQAVLANVAKNVVDTDAGLVLLMASGRHGLEGSLEYVRYIVKYRPRAPVLLITQDPLLARACAPWYGVIPKVYKQLPETHKGMELELFLEDVVLAAVKEGLGPAGKQVVCALQTHQPALKGVGVGAAGIPEAEVPMLRFKVAPGAAVKPSGRAMPRSGSKPKIAGSQHGSTGKLTAQKRVGSMGQLAQMFSAAPGAPAAAGGGGGGGGGARHKDSEAYWQKTLSLRNISIALEDILHHQDTTARKTKIVCTLGPSCWSDQGLSDLIDAGMNVARFNFSHGEHAGHKEVLDRLRKVAQGKNANVAYLLDTKGPEIRTAMLRGGKNLELTKGQEVILVAVGSEYKTWEGGINPDTGVAELGISYEKLAQSVHPGNVIKIADGGLSVDVTDVLDNKRVQGTCLNSKSVGQNKNVNLPGVHVDLPVLTSKDINDLVNFAVRYDFDFVAASFVQSGDDVRLIREVLDRSGGSSVKIISKIENEAGLEHYDDILSVTDGIMVARGDLAMEVPSEKVALAQKMMITKANIAGKFVVTATQMLESMTSNPLPTRAEMTDVANAVFDGTDAVMLSGETANGSWPTLAVSTMANIVAIAETANSYYSSCQFMMDHTTKPFSRMEAMAAAVCIAVTDADAQLIVVMSATGGAPRLISKYRPFVPQVVVTHQPQVQRAATVSFGQYGILVPVLDDAQALALQAMDWASEKGLWHGVGAVLVVSGHYEANADMMPTLRVFNVTETEARAAKLLADVQADEHELEVEGADEVSEELVSELSRKLSVRMSMLSPGPLTSLRRSFSKAS